MLPEEPVLDQLTFWVKEIDDLVCEPLVAGREDGDLVVLVGLFQTFPREGPHGEARRFRLTGSWILNRKLLFGFELGLVALVILLVPGAVDERFIQVEYHKILEAFLLELEVELLVFRDFLVLVAIEFAFEPGDLFVDFVGQLVVLGQLERLLDEALEVAPVEGGERLPTLVTEGPAPTGNLLGLRTLLRDRQSRGRRHHFAGQGGLSRDLAGRFGIQVVVLFDGHEGLLLVFLDQHLRHDLLHLARLQRGFVLRLFRDAASSEQRESGPHRDRGPDVVLQLGELLVVRASLETSKNIRLFFGFLEALGNGLLGQVRLLERVQRPGGDVLPSLGLRVVHLLLLGVVRPWEGAVELDFLHLIRSFLVHIERVQRLTPHHGVQEQFARGDCRAGLLQSLDGHLVLVVHLRQVDFLQTLDARGVLVSQDVLGGRGRLADVVVDLSVEKHVVPILTSFL